MIWVYIACMASFILGFWVSLRLRGPSEEAAPPGIPAAPPPLAAGRNGEHHDQWPLPPAVFPTLVAALRYRAAWGDLRLQATEEIGPLLDRVARAHDLED